MQYVDDSNLSLDTHTVSLLDFSFFVAWYPPVAMIQGLPVPVGSPIPPQSELGYFGIFLG
jgi:hypothetical protein